MDMIYRSCLLVKSSCTYPVQFRVEILPHEGSHWEEKHDRILNVPQVKCDRGKPLFVEPCGRSQATTDRNQPDTTTEPGLSHDVLQSYLIGHHNPSQFPIGQNPASCNSQTDLIGQLQTGSEDENCTSGDNEDQILPSELLNFENLIINPNFNKSSNSRYKTFDNNGKLANATAVNSSHPTKAECEVNLSNDQLGYKSDIKLGDKGENLHLETATTVYSDTVINNNPCSSSNLNLTNDPSSDLNGKSKCLLFSHARHCIEEYKYSTPGWKINSESINTARPLQYRSSTLEFYERKSLQNPTKPLDNSRSLTHEQSDLSSYYTAGSDFGSDFYGLSASSFITCREYLTLGPKSRFTKAKDILLRGRNYVKAKFSDYQKQFTRQEPAHNRKCTATCGFPCFFLGREVSQFSFGIPECPAAKGDNQKDSEEKGNHSNSNNDLNEVKEEFFTSNSCGTMSENFESKENHGITYRETDIDAVGQEFDFQPHGTQRYLGEGCKDDSRTSGQVHNGTTDGIMTVKVKAESTPGTSINGDTQVVTPVTMETGDGQDDMPVGTEAGTLGTDHDGIVLRSENDAEEKPTNKRLRWVSAMDKTQSSSLHSSTTSNSSVEQFLYEREMDPETMLKNLGFGYSPDTDMSGSRIPDRFLLSPTAASGIDLYKFVLHHPDLHHLLWLLDKTSENQSASGTGNQSTGRKSDSWGRAAASFSSLLHGMRFIQSTQSEVESHRPRPTDNTSVKDIKKLHSVLDLPNRAYLASQGFYGADYMEKKKTHQDEDRHENNAAPKPVTAAQRRKQFLQSSKSKNWSLTSEPEDDVSFTESSSGSIDKGLMLRSFSEGLSISSESSLEGADLFIDDDRQNSIKNLRRQYQETIRQSIDGEFPVFNATNTAASPKTEADNDKMDTLGDRRKKQVDRLMASLEDDGDYFAQSRQSSIKEVESVKKQSQTSKESTLISPMTPQTFHFSFEKGDERKFKFSTPGNQNENSQQEISIVVEDDTDSKSNSMSELDSEYSSDDDVNEGETTQNVKMNKLGLSPLALLQVRSDSSHTLVSQDSNYDNDSLGGDLTPRPGDISPGISDNLDMFVNKKVISAEDLSESASSSGTLSTMLAYDGGHGERSRSPSNVAMTTEPDAQPDLLKPSLVHPPQESFELEEILSADIGMDEASSYTRTSGRRGMMEKSASTHSDSSGFADLESAGEVTLSHPDLQQDMLTMDARKLGTSVRHDIIMTSHHHDSRNTQDALYPHPVSRMRQTDSRIKPNQTTVIKNDRNKNFHVCSVRQKMSPSDSDIPSLTSISYRNLDNESDSKSIVYTISVPYKGESSKSLNDLRSPDQGGRLVPERKFVSTMNIDVTVENSETGTEKHNAFMCKGPTKYKEFNLDLTTCDTSNFGRTKDEYASFNGSSDFNDSEKQSRKSALGKHEFLSTGTYHVDLLPSNRSKSKLTQDRNIPKKKLSPEKKSKELLASTKRQMEDWLLSNQKLESEMQNSGSSKRYGHPLSMSTPSLKANQFPNKHLLGNQKSLERHSFDSQEFLKEDRQPVIGRHRKQERNSFDARAGSMSSSDPPPSSHELFHYKSQEHADDYCDSSVVSSEDGVGAEKRVSLIESSLGMAEEHLEYLKLARLVNAPSNFKVSGIRSMQNVHYRPTVPVKHWTDLKRAKHLEEETRLMQYAVQRYKTELTAMETMLFNTCQLALSELNEEERADLEELRCLWSEVRKELVKLEEHLSYRLSNVLSGNDSFSPLSAMDIVSGMIDLLREQLYQQQLCISRDVVYEDDLDLLQSPDSSVRSAFSGTSDVAMAEFSQQISDVRQTIMKSQRQQQKDLNQSFSDLKEAIMAEVRSEMVSNTKWLQLRLQEKDSEIQKLRTEMFLQNLRAGTTRKRQYFESDV